MYNYISFQIREHEVEDMKNSTSMENYCFQRARNVCGYFGFNDNCNGRIFKQAIKNPGDYIDFDKDVKLYDANDKYVWNYWVKTIRMLACYCLEKKLYEIQIAE